MTAQALLRSVTTALREAEIPFMLTGSLAAAVHGAGRATMDIDLVIDPSAPRLEVFVRRMTETGVYASAEAAREALAKRTMFNVIDTATGWKADLIIRGDRPFSHTEFARRIPGDFGGVALDVATVEDVILSKLEWARKSGSSRQIEDVRTLLRIRGSELDRAYLGSWIARLDLGPEWTLALNPV